MKIDEISKDIAAYKVTISPHIYNRLDKHIVISKRLIDKSSTKQRWIIKAIKEKLINDEFNVNVPKATTLNVKIDDELENQIQNKIEYIKQFRFSYSKKQWIVDAILEKLDRDEKEMEKMISDPQALQIESVRQQISNLQVQLASLQSRFSSN